MKTIITFVFIILITLLISCSSTSEADKENYSFAGFSEISKGDTTKLKWNFPNGDKVDIDKFDKSFESNDSLMVFPDTTTLYNFKVISGNDTNNYSWQVKVIGGEEYIQTGPEFDFKGEWLPSYTETDYLIGRLGKSVDANPVKLKIMKFKNQIKEDGFIEYRFTLIDEFGNFIPSYFEKNDTKLFLNALCGNDVLRFSSKTINEIHNENISLNLSVNVENSFAAGEFEPVSYQFSEFFKSLTKNDKVKLNYFNQKNTNIFDYTEPETATEIMNMTNLPLPKGLNGLYKNTYKEIKTISGNNNNIFIIINFSPDNSSVIYNANDLVKSALTKQIPIYIISVGYAINTYNLKYITDRTGGKYYNIHESKISELTDILKEIYYSHKSHYSLKFPINLSDVNNCTKFTGNISIENNERLASEFRVIQRERQQYTDYQALVSFEYKQTVISESYNENIKNLAEVLMQNPDMVIQLTGNSSIEGDNDYNMDISLKRAQEARKQLIFYGAKSNQIRVKAEGSNLPVYFLQQEAWQQYYNRRVEVKWLDPSLLPYEIIDELYETETQALKKVEEWEKLGYMAYYDRYLINNNPHYRVKLWGYPTLEEAQNKASELESKYNKIFKVQ